MKRSVGWWFGFAFTFALTVLLMWGWGHRGYSQTPTPAQILLEEFSDCELVDRIEDEKILEVEFPPACLDEKLRLYQFIDLAKQQVNQNEIFPLIVKDLRYRLIDEGVQIRGNLEIDYPVVGLVDFEVSQTVFAELLQGALNLRAGETQVRVDVPFFESNDLGGLVNQIVDTQLTIFNRKSLQDFLSDTGLDERIAEETDLSVEAVNFIAKAVEPNISAKITEEALILSVRFYPE
ncbi:hypothetical protein [Baaleninema sp.]|uniref:hypothetical protein n=1 Tax=Baaleninema sp. TaxID=3101197 RepID=UPI003D0430F4